MRGVKGTRGGYPDHSDVQRFVLYLLYAGARGFARVGLASPTWNAGCVTRPMHELSIVMSIVEKAREDAERRGVQVPAGHLRAGALSGVVKDALFFFCEMACQDTPLAGSRS
jgi:hypothetical protein